MYSKVSYSVSKHVSVLYKKNNFKYHPVFYNWHGNVKKNDSLKSILDKTSEHQMWLVKSRGWVSKQVFKNSVNSDEHIIQCSNWWNKFNKIK